MVSPDADVLAGLARQLSAQPDLDTLWERLVQAAVSQVDGAEHASITLLSRKSVSTPVVTSELVRRADEQQYLLGEGPCLSAALHREPVVRVDDLPADPRWPHFAEAAAGLGIRSVLSYQLHTATGTIGALNVYAAQHNAFTEESVRTGQLLATHAALAAAASIEKASLRSALRSRDIIGQAKGILMNRYTISAEQAFDLLVDASQTTNRKLRDVAATLTETGELGTGRPHR